MVVVANEDLSLAIGRQGQNVKLATKLLGMELDVFGEDEFAALPDAERRSILGEPPEPVVEAATALETAETVVSVESTKTIETAENVVEAVEEQPAA